MKQTVVKSTKDLNQSNTIIWNENEDYHISMICAAPDESSSNCEEIESAV
jgi:hypothetical protein